MVFVKILGFFDVVAAIIIVLAGFHVSHWKVLVFCAAYLGIKGLMFFRDVASKIDLIIGVYCLLAIVYPVLFISILAGVYLGLKAVMSFG
jgi:hypothetical protein